jgi:hypothetical protein
MIPGKDYPELGTETWSEMDTYASPAHSCFNLFVGEDGNIFQIDKNGNIFPHLPEDDEGDDLELSDPA